MEKEALFIIGKEWWKPKCPTDDSLSTRCDVSHKKEQLSMSSVQLTSGQKKCYVLCDQVHDDRVDTEHILIFVIIA